MINRETQKREVETESGRYTIGRVDKEEKEEKR